MGEEEGAKKNRHRLDESQVEDEDDLEEEHQRVREQQKKWKKRTRVQK